MNKEKQKSHLQGKTYRRDPMFNYYWEWTDFSVGFSIAKPNRVTGWNWYVSLELGFLSLWLYF